MDPVRVVGGAFGRACGHGWVPRTVAGGALVSAADCGCRLSRRVGRRPRGRPGTPNRAREHRVALASPCLWGCLLNRPRECIHRWNNVVKLFHTGRRRCCGGSVRSTRTRCRRPPRDTREAFMNEPAPNAPPAYPRPQLVRADWTDLCGEWEFQHDDDEVGLEQAGIEGDIPLRADDCGAVTRRSRRCPESTTPVITPWCWYRRRFARAGRAAGAAAFRGGGLPGHGVGRTGSWSPPRGRAHPVHGRYHHCPARSGRHRSGRRRHRRTRWWSVPRIARTTPPNPAANRIGAPNRTWSGTTGRPGSGSPSGWRPCPTCMSRTWPGSRMCPVRRSGWTWI